MALVARFALVLICLLGVACHRTEVPRQTHHARHVKPPRAYIVKPGDTLYSIGRRFGIDYHVLARRNHIRPPYRIYVGQRLSLRGTATPARRLPGVTAVHRAHAKRSHRARPSHQPAHKPRLHLIWPVRGKVTSPFGRRGSRMHDGIDIAAAEGSAVVAAASGKVVYAGQRLRGYGRMVIIRHAHNVFTAYAHNQRLLVYKGQKVKQGAIIARVGHSGRATGPHLHFEVRLGTTAVDPLAYLPRR